jgi:hypothetical protein
MSGSGSGSGGEAAGNARVVLASEARRELGLPARGARGRRLGALQQKQI